MGISTEIMLLSENITMKQTEIIFLHYWRLDVEFKLNSRSDSENRVVSMPVLCINETALRSGAVPRD